MFWKNQLRNDSVPWLLEPENPGVHYLALRDWEPYFTTQYMDTDDLDPSGPKPEKPAVLDTRPPGLELRKRSLNLSTNSRATWASMTLEAV